MIYIIILWLGKPCKKYLNENAFIYVATATYAVPLSFYFYPVFLSICALALGPAWYILSSNLHDKRRGLHRFPSCETETIETFSILSSFIFFLHKGNWYSFVARSSLNSLCFRLHYYLARAQMLRNFSYANTCKKS